MTAADHDLTPYSEVMKWRLAEMTADRDRLAAEVERLQGVRRSRHAAAMDREKDVDELAAENAELRALLRECLGDVSDLNLIIRITAATRHAPALADAGDDAPERVPAK